jgi:hypothetical protein
MDTSSAPYTEQDYPYNPSLSYGRSDYTIGRQEKVFGMWQPVILSGGHSWLKRIAGGWSVGGILNLHTGFPWNPVYSHSGGSLYCSTCGYYSPPASGCCSQFVDRTRPLRRGRLV